MITGPRTTERSITAPASITTLPSTRDSASTVPSMRALDACRGSAGWPRACPRACPCPSTSPSTMCGRTSRPRSIRSWMASVISSSLRKLGLDRLDRVEDRRREHVDADQRQIALRLLRLLDQPHDPAVRRARRRRTSADSGTARQQDLRRPASRARTPRRTRVMPLFRQVVAEVHHERSRSPMNGSLMSTAWASPRGASCSM